MFGLQNSCKNLEIKIQCKKKNDVDNENTETKEKFSELFEFNLHLSHQNVDQHICQQWMFRCDEVFWILDIFFENSRGKVVTTSTTLLFFKCTHEKRKWRKNRTEVATMKWEERRWKKSKRIRNILLNL